MKIALEPSSGKRHRIGIIGCGWVGGVHADAIRMLPNAEVVACSASRLERAEAFAREKAIPRAFGDYRQVLGLADVDAVIIGTPNHLHHGMALAALEAGKHVIIEKPLAMTLEECEEIAAAGRRAGRVVGYAEELCFVPKFVRAKELADAGAVGQVRLVKQIEKHEGPHSRWFYEPDQAGGGITIDMGCHSIEFARWFLGKPRVTAVWATMDTWLHRDGLHRDVTEEEDHVVIHLWFEGGATALLESAWTLKGGMDSRTEIHGTGGVLYADLLQAGMGMKMFSESGAGAGGARGWSHPDVAWNFQNGYPHEVAHFLRCMETGETPLESADDGVAVMEVMLACYQSAGTGAKVELPFRPRGVKRPIDLWKRPVAVPLTERVASAERGARGGA